jgi:hypothetical protein
MRSWSQLRQSNESIEKKITNMSIIATSQVLHTIMHNK